jgi:hypothetical protein
MAQTSAGDARPGGQDWRVFIQCSLGKNQCYYDKAEDF